jgi:PKD repeat protein
VAVALVLGATYFLLVNTAPTPVFSFTPLGPVAGEPVIFSANATTDAQGDPISFRWQFGDGSPNATGPWVAHTFPRSGSYSVTLTATDDHRNANSATQSVPVAAGSITAPLYAYGDQLAYNVVGRSHVEGVIAPLATVNFTFGAFSGSCQITAVDLSYEGPQTRTVLGDPATALDGFLDPRETFVLERSLDPVQVLGQVNVSGCPPTSVPFSGSATVLERSFQNLQNNDTVRAETTEQLAVTIDTDPPRAYDSSAALTDFPELADAASQLRLENVYAGRRFSTENVSSGEFAAEGIHWLWITQGTAVVAGSLAVKVHLQADNLPPQRVSSLYIDLWVSSASSFPLREFYYVRGIDGGRQYESVFDATAAGPGAAGVAAIPYGNGTRAYRSVSASDLAPLTQVPRSTAGADFAFTARTAFDEGVVQCPDLATFMLDNPNAYAVNGTYSRSTGNPKWTLDFSQDPAGAAERLEDEHSTATQVRCGGAPDSAKRPRSEIGDVVSLNYAADLMEREATAAALFPTGAFDALRANFTIRQDLGVPSVSLNAALTASRSTVPYAFGGESLPSQPERTTAYVDAATGQLMYVLRETGDRLP